VVFKHGIGDHISLFPAELHQPFSSFIAFSKSKTPICFTCCCLSNLGIEIPDNETYVSVVLL